MWMLFFTVIQFESLDFLTCSSVRFTQPHLGCLWKKLLLMSVLRHLTCTTQKVLTNKLKVNPSKRVVILNHMKHTSPFMAGYIQILAIKFRCHLHILTSGEILAGGSWNIDQSTVVEPPEVLCSVCLGIGQIIFPTQRTVDFSEIQNPNSTNTSTSPYISYIMIINF